MTDVDNQDHVSLQTLRRHVREALARRIADDEDLIEGVASMVYAAYAKGIRRGEERAATREIEKETPA